LQFESDLTSGRCGVGSRASPVAAGSGHSFESLDDELLRRGGSRSSTGRDEPTTRTPSRGICTLPRVHELARVEGRRIVEDGVLAGVEVGELLVVEVMEAAGEIAVGLKACVVPGGSGVWT
jgi:hypothetical protein